MIRTLSVACAMAIAFCAPGAAAVAVTKTGDSLVDAKALTIKGSFGRAINGKAFQQDVMVTHKGWQYLGYYNAERRVCLARRRLPKGAWEVFAFTDYKFKSNDAHNTISIGVCPADGTLHVSFDHHNNRLHYRVSRKGLASDPAAIQWKPDLFGGVRSWMEKGRTISITYPRFWQTPDGGLQFCYRRGGSGNGDRMLVDYDPAAGAWKGTRQIDSRKGSFQDKKGKSSSRCSYPNGYDYGPAGKLHATWVWRESSGGANHDLVYVYSEDRGKTWRNGAGEVLEAPPGVNSPGVTAVKISRAHGLMNTHGQAVDSKGRVHVVMWHCTEESIRAAGSKPGQHRWGPAAARRNHHYWRDEKGAWQHRELPGPSGSRPKIFADKDDNAYVICGIKGELAIFAATAASKWTNWKVAHTEKGAFGNEMLLDPCRWKAEGVLSVMVQGSPENDHQPTALRVLDFTIRAE
ncbi:MAG: BNR repeat-containing protein [Planctomycetota bacterium]|jgi:hypothetical protein